MAPDLTEQDFVALSIQNPSDFLFYVCAIISASSTFAYLLSKFHNHKLRFKYLHVTVLELVNDISDIYDVC